MIREVAYRRLTREERRVRHIRAAEYFAQLEEIEFAGAVAGHYMSAHGVADAPHAPELAAEATAALTDAADRAARLHSHAQALAMIEQALTFVTDPAVEATLWQRASRSARALARHETAVGYAYRALDWYQQNGDPEEISAAALLVGNGLCHAFRAPEAIEVLEPIVDADPNLSSPAVVRAAAELARAYLMALRDREAAELGDRVMGPAERFDLVPTVVDVLITRGTAVGNLGRLHEAVALLRGANEYAQEHDLPLSELRAANNLGHLLAYDDHTEALESCRRGMELANRIGDVGFIGSFSWAVAAYLDRDGRWEEAQALRNEVRDQIEMPASDLVWYELTDLLVRVEHGDTAAIELAHDAVRRSVDEANPQSQAGVALSKARLSLLAGALDNAYGEAMNVDDEMCLPDHLAVAAVAAALMGDVDRLETVAAGLASSQARGRMVGAIRCAASGALAALRGDTTTAVADFSKALAFRFLRLDRAALQALFASMVGLDVEEASRAGTEAQQTLSEIGSTAYLNLYAAGMPPPEAQYASGS
jgi:tetratricopeptide (TPR) repeat protein